MLYNIYMRGKIIIWLSAFFILLLGAAFYASPYFINFLNSRYAQKLPQIDLASSTLGLFFSDNAVNKIITLPETKEVKPPPQKTAPTSKLKTSRQVILPPAQTKSVIKEVSSKSLTELINSSIVQLYCGNMNAEKTQFSEIARGTGVIINSNGIILTNRHIIYDEIFKKAKSDCFVLKSPFPNSSGQRPKIYYFVKIENWPQTEKFSKDFSPDKYYNDFALLKADDETTAENSKIGAMLGFDYAGPDDYKIVETDGKFNYFPVDWTYIPRAGDNLISAGYGTDASHEARQVTSSAGTVSGGIQALGAGGVEMLIVEGNATTGFSGGALIHPQSKGLVGLVSWVSAGADEGKFTVAIFRDFLSLLMKEEFNIDSRQLTAE